MKILIATGIYPPDIGGSAQYARGVEEAWKKAGHKVKVLAFRFERKLPSGIRHLHYFFRVLFSLPGADFVFSPDTFSAAFPALCAAKLLCKKIIIRTGGDFLWEWYVERTGDLILLRDFYTTRITKFNLKERTIFKLLRFLFHHADAIIFSTPWQRDIFEKPYELDLKRCFIIESFYGEHFSNNKLPHTIAKEGDLKVFVGGTRTLKWKNLEVLRSAFFLAKARRPEILLDTTPTPREQFLGNMERAYAVIIASLGDISPNTILEAIAYGKPFILTRETGLYEKLKDIGVWVDPEDVGDIAERVTWLADEKNYEAQCDKIRSFTFKHSFDEIAGEILVIYRNMLHS